MRMLGEQQLALLDTIKPPVPPSPAPQPPAAVRPKPAPTPCDEALERYGPHGARFAGLVTGRK
jgi:hypothetical protein